MKKDIFARQAKKAEGFLKQENRFIAGGLVLLIYVIMLLYLRIYLEGEHIVKLLVHVMPVFAAGLFIMGYFDRRRQEQEEKERKKKRYQARMTLSRLQREQGGAAAEPGDKRGTQ